MSNSSGFSNKRKSQSPFSSQVKKMKMKPSSKKRLLNKTLPFMQKSPEILSLEKQIKLMQDKLTLIEKNQKKLQQESLERQSSAAASTSSTVATNGDHDNSKRSKADDEASKPSTSQRTNCKRKRKNTDLTDDQGKLIFILRSEMCLFVNLFVYFRKKSSQDGLHSCWRRW